MKEWLASSILERSLRICTSTVLVQGRIIARQTLLRNYGNHREAKLPATGNHFANAFLAQGMAPGPIPLPVNTKTLYTASSH